MNLKTRLITHCHNKWTFVFCFTFLKNWRLPRKCNYKWTRDNFVHAIKLFIELFEWGNHNFNPHYASIQCSMQLIVQMEEEKIFILYTFVQCKFMFTFMYGPACVRLCMCELRSRLFMYLKLFCSSNIKWDNKYDFAVVLSINCESEHKINEKATLPINSWYVLTKYVNRAFVWDRRIPI